MSTHRHQRNPIANLKDQAWIAGGYTRKSGPISLSEKLASILRRVRTRQQQRFRREAREAR